jgi:hypothetical protein
VCVCVCVCVRERERERERERGRERERERERSLHSPHRRCGVTAVTANQRGWRKGTTTFRIGIVILIIRGFIFS